MPAEFNEACLHRLPCRYMLYKELVQAEDVRFLLSLSASPRLAFLFGVCAEPPSCLVMYTKQASCVCCRAAQCDHGRPLPTS